MRIILDKGEAEILAAGAISMRGKEYPQMTPERLAAQAIYNRATSLLSMVVYGFFKEEPEPVTGPVTVYHDGGEVWEIDIEKEAPNV